MHSPCSQAGEQIATKRKPANKVLTNLHVLHVVSKWDYLPFSLQYIVHSTHACNLEIQYHRGRSRLQAEHISQWNYMVAHIWLDVEARYMVSLKKFCQGSYPLVLGGKMLNNNGNFENKTKEKLSVFTFTTRGTRPTFRTSALVGTNAGTTISTCWKTGS